MKINNKQESLAVTASLFAGTIVLSAIVAIASAIYTNKVNMDEEIADHKILISKIETLNKVNSMYEASYKTGFENCIKLNPENACAKRFNQITNHFSNEYNTKLLKLLAEQSGIKLSEDITSGRLTAVTNTPEHDDEISGLVKYYITIVANDSDRQEIIKHKDEVVSIGSKFAELGLEAQNKNSETSKFLTQLHEIDKIAKSNGGYTLRDKEDLGVAMKNYGGSQIERSLDLIKLAEVTKTSSAIGKAPDLTDTLVNSGKKLFNASISVNNNSQTYKDKIETPDLMKLLELEQAKNSGGSDSAVGKEKSWVEKTAE